MPSERMQEFDVDAAIDEAIGKLPPLRRIRARAAMLLRPAMRQEVRDRVTAELAQRGMIGVDEDNDRIVCAATDWSAIIALILEILPLILRLFGL